MTFVSSRTPPIATTAVIDVEVQDPPALDQGADWAGSDALVGPMVPTSAQTPFFGGPVVRLPAGTCADHGVVEVGDRTAGKEVLFSAHVRRAVFRGKINQQNKAEVPSKAR